MDKNKIHLLERPIHHRIGTLMVMAVFILLGIIGFFNLPINLMPDIVYPMIRVQVRAGQTPPDILVNTVTRVLEQQLAQAEGVELIESSTTQGQAQITLSFAYSQNIDGALRDVSSLVDRIKAQLPEDLEAPVIFKFDPQNLPVLELVMTSQTMDVTTLRHFADKDLIYRFAGVPGISVVRPSGGKVREIQVQVNPEVLKRYNFTLADLNTWLASGNTQRAVGRVDAAGSEHIALATSLAGSVETLQDMRIIVPTGAQVRLKDIADVQDTSVEQRIVIKVNSQEGVKLSFFKNPEANSVDVAQAITERLQEIKDAGTLPADLEVTTTSNESNYIVNSIANAQHALLLAVALVTLIVLVFLKNWRITLISLAVLPVALLVTIFLMSIFGLSFNLMSIGGLIVGVTLMVDYGIVFIENIHRHWAETKNILISVREAANEVSAPLTTSLIALIAVIIPFLFFGGLSLLFFKEFILVVIFATFSGLVIAFALIPILYSLVNLSDTSSPEHEGLQINGLIRFHRRTLDFALRYRSWSVAVGLLCLVFTWHIATLLGNTFLPEVDDGRIALQIQAEPGTLLSGLQQQVQRLESLLEEEPDVELVDVTTGGRIGQTIQETPAEAEILVQLTPKTERGQSVQAFMASLSDKISALDLTGMKVKVKKARIRAIRTFSGTASSGDFDVVVNIEGQEPRVLDQIGEDIQRTLRSVEGLADIRATLTMNQPILNFTIHEDKAATFGVSPTEIAQTLASGINGSIPSRFLQNGEYYNIRVLLTRPSVHENLTGLPTIPVRRLQNGDVLLLEQVANIQFSKGPLAIDRINQTAVNMINGSARGRTLGEVANDVKAALDGISLPAGYRISYGGRMATLDQGGSGLVWVGLFGLFLLLVVLAVGAESFVNPLLIVVVLPVGLLGAMLALYVSGMPLSATAMIGFILVIGIATNNAIVLVAFIEQLRASGYPLLEAVKVGTSLRIQPKLMTATIAMAGMIPLAIGREEGGEILQPLAMVILGGMPVSLLATIILLPVLYIMVHERRLKQR